MFSGEEMVTSETIPQLLIVMVNHTRTDSESNIQTPLFLSASCTINTGRLGLCLVRLYTWCSNKLLMYVHCAQCFANLWIEYTSKQTTQKLCFNLELLLPFKLKCKKPILIHLLHKILISLQTVKTRGRVIAKQEFLIYFLVMITWQHFRLLCSFRRSN